MTHAAGILCMVIVRRPGGGGAVETADALPCRPQLLAVKIVRASDREISS